MLNYLLFLTPFLSVVWTLPFVIFLALGITLRQIKDHAAINRLKRTILLSTLTDEGGKPKGFFFGKWYFGYVHETIGVRGNNTTIVYILSTKSVYERLMNHETKESKEPKEMISIWERIGNFFHLDYLKRMLDVSQFKPRRPQTKIIGTVQEHLKKRTHCVLYLHGDPGTGKSMVGILLTKHLKGTYCKTWNPAEPGDSISKIYSQASPTEDCPLILVLDEFDILIGQIHSGTIQPHKNIPIQVKNKTDWNGMLDDISLGMYPHMILLLTSNHGPDFIRSMDRSYIREGRVDLIMGM